jgi:hypothetical protein
MYARPISAYDREKHQLAWGEKLDRDMVVEPGKDRGAANSASLPLHGASRRPAAYAA